MGARAAGYRREVVGVVLPQALAGVVVGGVWAALAPSGSAREVLAGQDALFAVLGLLAGAVAGLAVAARPGPRPLARLAALVAGGAVGSVVAAVPALLDDDRGLTAVGVLGLWPAAAATAAFVGSLVAATLASRSAT